MSISPVKFAMAFERLRTQLGAVQSESARLQLLMTFWPEIMAVEGNQTFNGFVEEYGGLLAKALTAAAIADLDADGLAQLESQIADLRAVDIGADKIAVVKLGRARLLLYLGETEAGIAAAAKAAELQYEIPEHSAGGRLRDEFERFEQAYNALPESDLRRHLQPILEDWQARREAVHHDRAVCVFVAKGTAEGNSDGRLRVLRARVEPASKAAPGDQVTFDNQIRTPQDPFVGSAYAALAAVRGYLAEASYSGRAKGHLNAHFTVEDSGETFTGDSIGLAIALLTYTQLLQLEVERQDRFLSAEVAYTGAVSPEGEILPVSDESIGAKVKRVFHSPVRFLVLPQANYPAARAALEQLEAAYPRRSLTLIPVRHLADCLNDHNVVRSQKVCIGEYVARRAAKYGRMTTVQAATILVVVGYLLLCLTYPKAWPWFDWNPQELKLMDNRIIALNAGGQFLWDYNFATPLELAADNWAIADLDSDGRNEVLVVPYRFGLGYSESNGRLFVFSSSGDTLFTRDGIVRGVYPSSGLGASGDSIPTEGACVYVRQYRGRSIVITCVAASSPARGFVKFWNSAGDQTGQYVNSGYAFCIAFSDFDGDGIEEALIKGTNNRLNCTTLFTLDPLTADGVSPPYILGVSDGKPLDLRGVSRGTQKKMVFLPPSELLQIYGKQPYQTDDRFREMPDETIELWLGEGSEDRPIQLIYVLDRNLRVRSVFASDSYNLAYKQAVAEGKLPSRSIEEFEQLILSRTYYCENGMYKTQSGEVRDTPPKN